MAQYQPPGWAIVLVLNVADDFFDYVFKCDHADDLVLGIAHESHRPT